MELHPDLLMPNAALAVAELIAAGILTWLIARIGNRLIVAFANMELSEGKRCMGDERTKLVAAHFSRVVKAAGGLAALGAVGYNFWLTAAGYNGPNLVVQQVSGSEAFTLPALAGKLGGIIGVLVLVKLLSWLGQQFREWLVGVLIAAEVVRVTDERVERIGDHSNCSTPLTAPSTGSTSSSLSALSGDWYASSPTLWTRRLTRYTRG